MSSAWLLPGALPRVDVWGEPGTWAEEPSDLSDSGAVPGCQCPPLPNLVKFPELPRAAPAGLTVPAHGQHS